MLKASLLKYPRLTITLISACFCLMLSWFDLVKPLDRMFYDIAVKFNSLPNADDILIIAVDERSILELGRWPWPRERHVELLRLLKNKNPSAVAFDVIFSEPDIEYPQVDELLGKEISQLGNVILPVFIAQVNIGGQLLEIEPMPIINNAANQVGHVHIPADEDGVTRAVYLKEGLGTPFWPHFSVAIGKVIGLDNTQLPGSDKPVSATQQLSALSITRSHHNLIPIMGPAGTVKMVSWIDVINNRIPEREMLDKIIFIGITASGYGDNVTTSFGQISGVELNANIFQALRSGLLIQVAPKAMSTPLSSILAMLIILFITRLARMTQLLAILLSATLIPLAALLSLQTWQFWISPAPVLLTLVFTYPLWSWLRLNLVMQFIEKQLRNLSAENRVSPQDSQQECIENMSTFLQSLEKVDNWELRSVRTTQLPNSGSDHWQHDSNSSSKYFFCEGAYKLLLLTWSGKRKIPMAKFEKLFPDVIKNKEVEKHYSQSSRNALLQLDQAQRKANHLRKLAMKSVEQLGAGIILSSSSGKIHMINRQARNLLSLQSETKDLLQVLCRINGEPTLNITELVSSLMFDHIHFNFEGKSPDSSKDLLCQGSTIALDQTMLIFSITDVSELKASESFRTEGLNFLSHDLRAPLASVLALIQGAKSEHPSEINLELMGRIEKYINQNLSYAENYIQLSRLKQATQPPFEDCEAQSLIDSAVAQLFHIAKQNNIKFQFNACPDEIWTNCNRDLIERALTNLIDNAIKHSPQFSTITIAVSYDTNSVIFKVVDKGKGISVQEQDSIFDSFQQGAHVRTGVGLGLRFSSSVAQMHKGQISVFSTPGQGATFILSIPRLSKPAILIPTNKNSLSPHFL